MLLSKTLDIGPYAGVTFLSGNACEGGQVTGLDSLFYPDLRKINFRGIFLIMNAISNQNPDKKENLVRGSKYILNVIASHSPNDKYTVA